MVYQNVNIIPALKNRLSRPLPGLRAQLRMAPSFRSTITKNHKVPRAGVLILLYQGPDGLRIVFMKRPEYDGVHSGQISFPGGKEERSDQSIIHTALRETKEEIGIPVESIQVLGSLTPLYIPVSETEVFPTVGYSIQMPVFQTDPHEVDYLIETDLEAFFDPSILKTKPYNHGKFIGEIPFFDIQGNHVWGATAMILSEFLEIIEHLED